jgi:hypothetical protein
MVKVYAPKAASNQSSTSFFAFTSFLVLLSCFAHLCCFEEKSIRINLTGQGSTKFHASHQSFCANTLFSEFQRCETGGPIVPYSV